MSSPAAASASSAVVYRSRVGVVPGAGKLKMVTVPLEAAPVPMGVHGAIAEHYRLAEGAYEPHASTLDYIVGATAGCLMGTLNSALIARGVPTGDGRLTAEAVGDVEAEDGVLVIRRIHVTATLRAAEAHRAAAERVAAVYPAHCPSYRSLRAAIAITTELSFQAVD